VRSCSCIVLRATGYCVRCITSCVLCWQTTRATPAAMPLSVCLSVCLHSALCSVDVLGRRVQLNRNMTTAQPTVVDLVTRAGEPCPTFRSFLSPPSYFIFPVPQVPDKGSGRLGTLYTFLAGYRVEPQPKLYVSHPPRKMCRLAIAVLAFARIIY